MLDIILKCLFWYLVFAYCLPLNLEEAMDLAELSVTIIQRLKENINEQFNELF